MSRTVLIRMSVASFGLLAMLFITACNTMEGAGEDIESAGENIQDAADD